MEWAAGPARDQGTPTAAADLHTFSCDSPGLPYPHWSTNWAQARATELPSHVVFYDAMAGPLRPFLVQHGFQRIGRYFHAHISDEGNYLELWERS